jgi:hypothetical protein
MLGASVLCPPTRNKGKGVNQRVQLLPGSGGIPNFHGQHRFQTRIDESVHHG